MYNFIKYVAEGKVAELKQVPLSYDRDDLAPSVSEDTMNYHYGHLYKTYVDRYNKREGDPDFNEAGAFLHDIYFTQFRPPKGSNQPAGKSKDFIEEHYKSFDKFKDEFKLNAMKIQGSGWAYLAKNGDIKTIKNHEIKQDIVLLIDWWEHSWSLDYKWDKESYLNNQWKIIDWDVINQRL